MKTKNILIPTSLNVKFTPFIGQLEELTVNWHITEACNYGCQYCYAHWSRQDRRELHHDPNCARELLGELFQFFRPDNLQNPLRKQLIWKAVRLNLAGGEPTILHNHLIDIARVACDLGFNLSIISNGSQLDVLLRLAPYLKILGISLDSADLETNRKIGRVDNKGRLLDVDKLIRTLHQARSINPALLIKINTVVNKPNVAEDLGWVVEQIRPDRWKILRVLPVINSSLNCSDEEFAAYVYRHKDFRSIQCIEDNQDMCESYLMVDPYGRFFQNRSLLNGNRNGYDYSKPILSVGAHAAFSEIMFNSNKFQSRYSVKLIGRWS